MLFALLQSRRDVAGNVTPAELNRMMRRYGIDARDIGSTGLTEDFAGACRNCAVCDRKAQCREWLELSPPGDIPLFCGNEPFLTRVNYAKVSNPRLAHSDSLPNRTQS
jgi:hypothetical protein